MKVNLPMCGHDNIERWGWLAQRLSKLLICFSKRWIDVLGRPAVPGNRPEGTRANNDSVGNGSQQAHDQLVMLIEPTDISSPARMARFIQRHDAIEGGDKVGKDERPTWVCWQVEATIEGRERRWQEQDTAMSSLEE
jgi:hypothetical protein